MGEVLALIPARGGSKSVPRKNLLSIGGKPLIAYSIEHGLDCPSITRVVVSTDDAEIAEVARAAGAEVPFKRPSDLATDTATDLDVFRHALEWLERRDHYCPELVVHLRPTGPVRDVASIDRAVALMHAHPEADSLRSVGLAEETPFKMWFEKDGYLEPVIALPDNRESHSLPRQALPLVYRQNGYVDIVRPRTVLELGSMVGQRPLAFIVSGKVPELDYPDQIPLVEQALRGGTTGPWEETACLRHPA